jgi:single-stranded DNA-binding protein
MNSVTLAGRLVTKPKLAPTDKGRPVCDVRLLVDNGPYPAFKIDVSVFDAAAHICAEQRSRGDKVRVEGELRYRIWRDRANRQHEGFSIIGRVEPLDRASGQDAENGSQPGSASVSTAQPAATVA